MVPSLAFAGRRFCSEDISLVIELTRNFPSLSLMELSSTVCELLQWKRSSGKLKYKECRAFLEQLQRMGVVSIPAVRQTAPSRPRAIAATPRGDPQAPLTGSVGQYLPLELHRVEAGSELSSLWNEYVDRYHYLHYRVPFGANLRYLVESQLHRGRYLACFLFSSSAWKMAPRDEWIGWSLQQRQRNLQHVVSNSRFLILPWVCIRGLASKVLSLAARQLPQDWEGQYGCRPLLLETLVDSSRFQGTCYRAANWIYLGQSQGRGRMDRDHTNQGSMKAIYVFPLCRDARERLRSSRPLI